MNSKFELFDEKFNFSKPLIFSFLFILSFFIYKKLRRFMRVCNLMKKIPGPPTHFLLGNSILVLYLDKFKFKYGTYVLLYQMASAVNLLFGKSEVCKMWLGFKPFVILFTPDAIETILANPNLTVKADEYNFLKPWLGEGLVTSNNKKWKQRRKMLTPTFHFKILQDFLPVMNEHCSFLIEKVYTLALYETEPKFKILDKKITDEKLSQELAFKFQSKNLDDIEENYYDVIPILTLCTLDVICETAMGTKLNVQKKETDYVRCLQEVEKFFLWRLTRPWLWLDFIYKLTNDYKENKKCLDIMRDFTMNVIEKRKKIWLNYFEQYSSKNQLAKDDSKNETVETEENKEEEKFKNFFTGTKTRLAFLDLLLQQHFKDPKNFTLEDVREETDTFMFAGHDTTAMGLSWTIYMLGRYPLVQQKARNEVDEIIANMSSTCSCKHKIEFSLEDLKEMKYLECVLKEVQRIYPTAPFFGRRVTEDIPMKNYTIPEGSTVTIFTYAMHRNPKFYPNPLKFDPDRFLPENKSERHAYAFIPFSAGARNCIGQKFSSIEQKLILAKLLHNFYFESVDAEDKLVIVGEMVLKSKNGLRSKIYRRFNNEERYCSNCKLIEKNNLKEFVSKNL